MSMYSDIPQSAAKTAPRGRRRVLIAGNSYVFYGNAVTRSPATELTQEGRQGNRGYFYQLCRAGGYEAQVTDWTFGAHGLCDLFGGPCECEKSTCRGVRHETALTDRDYDWVILSPGGGVRSEKRLLADFDYIADFFRAVNPHVKIVCLGNLGAHAYSSVKLDLPGIYRNYGTLEDRGVIIADWGGLVDRIIRGEVSVPGATQAYGRRTFVARDNFHPNPLSGYIASLMAYCAITGESAVEQPWDFYNDVSRHERFDIPAYIARYDREGETNFPAVFASEADMTGIRQLIDRALAEKPYRLL